MTREELEKRLTECIAEAEEEIQGLPSDPEPRHIRRYQELMRKIAEWGQMLRDFCPPPKPEPDPELEDLLY